MAQGGGEISPLAPLGRDDRGGPSEMTEGDRSGWQDGVGRDDRGGPVEMAERGWLSSQG